MKDSLRDLTLQMLYVDLLTLDPTRFSDKQRDHVRSLFAILRDDQETEEHVLELDDEALQRIIDGNRNYQDPSSS